MQWLRILFELLDWSFFFALPGLQVADRSDRQFRHYPAQLLAPRRCGCLPAVPGVAGHALQP